MLTRARLAATILALLALAGPARAQAPEIANLQVRLQMGLAYERQAISRLQASSTPQEYRLADGIIYQGYVEIRWAHERVLGMIAKAQGRRNTGFVDPTLEMAARALEESRAHINAARFEVQYARPGETARIAKGIEHLQIASGKARIAMDLLP